MDTKKHWVKPQLVILVRGESEERVLVICKSLQGTGTIGAGNGANGCSTFNFCGDDCATLRLS